MQTYIDELDLGKWPSIYPDNSPTGGGGHRERYFLETRTGRTVNPWLRM